jgi:hypothetical protein
MADPIAESEDECGHWWRLPNHRAQLAGTRTGRRAKQEIYCPAHRRQGRQVHGDGRTSASRSPGAGSIDIGSRLLQPTS